MNRHKTLAPSISADGRDPVYIVRWPGYATPSEAWAEAFFDNHADAFKYYEDRDKELAIAPNGPRRLHPPMHSREDPEVWVICIDPTFGS